MSILAKLTRWPRRQIVGFMCAAGCCVGVELRDRRECGRIELEVFKVQSRIVRALGLDFCSHAASVIEDKLQCRVFVGIRFVD